MTTVPNTATASINHERGPVLLTSAAEWSTWLTDPDDDAMKLVVPIAGERLRIVQEGSSKKDELQA